MSFNLEQIDRGLEWHIIDEMVSRNLMPDKRSFIISNDIPGYNSAYMALKDKVKVFGVGNYMDRGQLEANNIIITRLATPDGDVGVSYPFFFDYSEATGNWIKKEGPQGSFHIEYEIRFYCDNVVLERKLSEAMLVLFPRRSFLKGILDEALTETEDMFLVTKPTPPVDMSTSKFIEKVLRVLVNDVDITPEKIIEEVAPATDISIFATPNIEKRFQDASDWDMDPETAKIKITVPEVISQSIEALDPSDIIINFNMSISILDQEKGLSFTILKDNIDVTSDIVSITKPTSSQIIITIGSPFSNGEVILMSYARDRGFGVVVSENHTEMEEIVGRNVVNNL